jgi:RND family efflux transporter MFP subunit
MDERGELLNSLKIERDQAPVRGARLPAWLVATLLLLALVAVLLSWRFGVAPGQDAAAPARTPDTTGAVAQEQPGPAADPVDAGRQEVLNASGYITARRMATVSARITGQIVEVLVEEGMTVAEGDVLARLDDALVRADFGLAQAQLAAARARIASAETSLAEAERVLGRVRRLIDTEYASEAELTRAEASRDQWQAALAQARAERQVAEFQLARQGEQLAEHVIRAPFAGVVTDKNAQPGEIVSPTSAGGGFTRTGICTIVDMDSLEIEVDVNEAFIKRVRPGQRVVANLDAYPEWDIPARVAAIIPAANRDRATVRVRIALETRDERILPDMGVKVAFIADTEPGETT